jgi:hypothetical protein
MRKLEILLFLFSLVVFSGCGRESPTEYKVEIKALESKRDSLLEEINKLKVELMNLAGEISYEKEHAEGNYVYCKVVDSIGTVTQNPRYLSVDTLGICVKTESGTGYTFEMRSAWGYGLESFFLAVKNNPNIRIKKEFFNNPEKISVLSVTNLEFVTDKEPQKDE